MYSLLERAFKRTRRSKRVGDGRKYPLEIMTTFEGICIPTMIRINLKHNVNYNKTVNTKYCETSSVRNQCSGECVHHLHQMCYDLQNRAPQIEAQEPQQRLLFIFRCAPHKLCSNVYYFSPVDVTQVQCP